MRAICEREDARWLPARHHYALFRLAAFLRLRFAKPRITPGVLLMIDRDQSQFENYAMSAWFTATLTCFVAATFFSTWPVALALLVAFPIAVALSQVTLVILALTAAPLWARFIDQGGRIGVVSIGTMMLVLVPTAYYATARTWIRWVSWHVLVLIALNALAAVLLFFLRGPIARLERAYEDERAYDDNGGRSSAS
ncbi:MAG TPA: hypothetical protein VGF48_10935 [Thermoanaerobaculia bacterium]|jgi:hypothetical protein